MVEAARINKPSVVALSDAALVLAALKGEPWAQQTLFRRHMAVALRLSQRILGREGEAEDVAQDAFVEALKHLEHLDNPQAFGAWLRSIVVRRAGKYLRRKQLMVRLGARSREPVDPDALIAPGAPPEIVHELRAIYSVIEQLPAEQRIALVLRRVEGLELTDIATHMELSLATVKRRLVAAEARLDRARAAL